MNESSRVQEVVFVPSPERPRRRRQMVRWLWRLALIVILLGLALIVMAGGWYFLAGRGRILPGLHVLGVPIGGYEPAVAANTLEHTWQTRPIRVHDENHALVLTPAQLGLVLDAPATAQAAYAVGRVRSPASAKLALTVYRAGGQVNPIWYFDTEAAEVRLRALAPDFALAPVDAGVTFADGRLVATAAQPGRELDIAATLEWLQLHAGWVVQNGQLPLLSQSVPAAISDEAVAAVVAEANGRLNTPLVLPLFDPISNERLSWEVEPDVWGRWLRLQLNGLEGMSLAWDVDAAQVEGFVAAQSLAHPTAYVKGEEAAALLRQLALGQMMGQPAATASLRIYHGPQQHVVQSGETLSSIAQDYGMPYPWIQQANPGVEGLAVGQVLIIPSADLLLPLPVVENKRIVLSLSQQRLWAYENETLKWEWPISTGIDSSPTSPGVFQIQSHEPNAYAGNWDLWMPNFMGIYRPVPDTDFMNGFHGFPTRNGSNLLWTNSLGTPVTYGCVLVGNDQMYLLYSWGEEGVVVEIRP